MFYLIVALVAILAPTTSCTVQAQQPAPASASATAWPQQCEDAEFLTACPRSCARACDDRAFQSRFRAACRQVLINRDGQDEPGKCERSSASAARFKKCVQDAESGETALDSIQRRPIPESWRKDLERLFKEFPTCSRSVPGLVGTFNCLKNEGDELNNEFTRLKGKGYDGPPKREVLCRIPEADMDADSLSADAMSKRAAVLKIEFDKTSACKRSVVEWLNLVSDPGNRMGQTVEGLIAWLREDLSPAEQTELQVGNLTGQLQEQITSMQRTIFAGVLMCPRKAARK